MFAQLLASRRSPAGVAASVALHGIVVAGAVLLTSHAPTRRASSVELITPVLAPPPVRHPVEPAARNRSPGAPLRVSIINVPLTVPDVIPPVDLLRAAINVDQPFEFRVGVPSRTGDPAATPIEPGAVLTETQVEVPVTVDARSPLPRYPQLMRDSGVEGMARVRFVVDTLGRAELSTVQVVESTHPAFALAVQAALPHMRFTPARLGDHRVRQLVEFPLQFRLNK